nr:unnamed protein product [Callosobruchus analis]CAI5849058.1 unnamed protein product [Callosobruchus analis]CAI5863278.1 unnamed protein product [Callosobruchus analis]
MMDGGIGQFKLKRPDQIDINLSRIVEEDNDVCLRA